MTELLETTAQVCARIDVSPDHRAAIKETSELLNKAGFPNSVSRLQKATAAGELPHVMFGGKCVYRLGSVIDWALANTKPGGATRRGRTRRIPRGAAQDAAGAAA